MSRCRTCGWADAEVGASNCRSCERWLSERVIATPCRDCRRPTSAKPDADPNTVRCSDCRDGVRPPNPLTPQPSTSKLIDEWARRTP